MLKFLRKTYLYLLAVPLLFTFLGAASNQLVLIANHDTFPVMVNDQKLQEMATAKAQNVFNLFRPDPAPKTEDAVMLDEVHCNMTSKTHLNALADIFDMKDAIYSVGDFSLMLGDWLGQFAPAVFLFAVARKLWYV